MTSFDSHSDHTNVIPNEREGSHATLEARVIASAAKQSTLPVFHGLLRQACALLAVAMLLTVVCFTAPARAQCPAVEESLAGHFKLDETVGTTTADATGGGATGTFTGTLTAATATTSGLIGTGFNFDDTQDYITMANEANFDFTGAFSVSFWMRIDAFSRQYETALSKGDAWGFQRDNLTNGMTFYVAGFTNGGVYTGGDVTGDVWRHIVGVYDQYNDDLLLYLDGTLVDIQPNPSGAPATDNAPLVIGRNQSTDFRDWDGDVDDVRIYGRALSAAEVQGLFNTRTTNPAGAGTIAYDALQSRLVYCNATEWVHAGIGSYNPLAVTFDGTNDFLNKATPLAGPSATTQWSGSFWLRRAGGIGAYQMIFDGPSIPIDDNSIDLQLDNRILFAARNAAGTIVLNLSSNAISDTNWHHVMFSFDLTDTAKRHVYIDGVSAINSVGTYNTTATMDFDMAGVNIGVSNSGGDRLNADLADLWLDFGTYIDLSVESNRRKFLSPAGMPMYLGPNGSIPTGAAPEIFMTGLSGSWHVNKGTGGGFTENGALTVAPTQPGDSLLSASNTIPLGWTSGLSNQLAYVAAAFENSGCTPQINNLVYDASTSNGTSFTLPSYAVPSVTDPMLIVLAAVEDDNTSSHSVPSSVTFNGVNLTQAVIFTQSADKTAAIYYMGNPPQTTANIVLTTPAQVESIIMGAFVASCVANQAPVVVDTDGLTGTAVSAALAGVPAGALVVDSFEHGDSSAATMVVTKPDQIVLYTQNDKNPGATSSQGASYLIAPESAVTGDIRYDPAYSVMKYYNGVEWVAMGPVGGTPPTSGLVGHWPLNETGGSVIDDISATNGDGTWYDAGDGIVATEATTGKISGGLSFGSAGNTRIIVPYNAAQQPTAAYTYAAWIKGNDDNDKPYDTATWGRFSRQQSFIYDSEGGGHPGSCHHRSADGSTYIRTWPINALAGGRWYFIACVWDGSVLTTYIDGIASGTNGPATILTTETGPLAIGGAYEGSGTNAEPQFDGVVDDLRIFNRALTVNEIGQLYQFGLSGGVGDVNNGCANAGSITGATAEGIMFYNTTHNVLQYCNGEQWIGVGK